MRTRPVLAEIQGQDKGENKGKIGPTFRILRASGLPCGKALERESKGLKENAWSRGEGVRAANQGSP